MTNKLAILLLRNIKIYHKGMSQREIQITKEALEMGIHALELFDRPSGYWIHKGDGDKCSACLEMVEGFPTRYCPNCGAKMKEETT